MSNFKKTSKQYEERRNISLPFFFDGKLFLIFFVHLNIKMDCNHEFENIELLGTFCKNCHIAYGVECLKPDCRILNCEKHNLIYSTFEDAEFDQVEKDMNNDIYCLHLGHDGVICGNEVDVRKVLSYSGLKIVEYCGYYMNDKIIDIFDENGYKHIKFVPIE